MKRLISTTVGLLFASILLISPLPAAAEDVDVAPTSWDFGDVELGTSRTHIFTLDSLGPTPVYIFLVRLTTDAEGRSRV
ncbi:MAG: hypothetical protein HY695_36020 [Deltaproteobacteria bacterium]|nr:hypothetical protein [Deltaproteobacteria bacterium]